MNSNGAGAGGKSTLNKLIRGLIGAGVISLRLCDWSKQYGLVKLPNAIADIADENPVGKVSDDITAFKSAVTGEPLTIDRKFLDDFTYQTPHIAIILAFNDWPRCIDKSGSFWRRITSLPFPKHFVPEDGTAIPEINDKFVKQTDVLEYVLYRVCQMPCKHSFTEYEYMKESISEMQGAVDPTYRFLNLHLDAETLSETSKCVWDFIPFQFLFDMYQKWFAKEYKDRKALVYVSFCNEVEQWCVDHRKQWATTHDDNNKPTQERPGKRMTAPEPLIAQYQLVVNGDGVDWWGQGQYRQARDFDKMVTVSPKKATRFTEKDVTDGYGRVHDKTYDPKYRAVIRVKEVNDNEK